MMTYKIMFDNYRGDFVDFIAEDGTPIQFLSLNHAQSIVRMLMNDESYSNKRFIIEDSDGTEHYELPQ